MKYGLKEQLFNEIVETIKSLGFVKKLVIYGSRARGDYKYNSDIDLAIDVDSYEELRKVYQVIDNVKMIYTFNLIDLNTISNEKFKANIEKDGIVLFDITNK